MDRQTIFVLGGASSGKTKFALVKGAAIGKKKIYLATAGDYDAEMGKKIRKHQQERGRSWQTVEEGINIDQVLIDLNTKCDVLVLDCLTLWLSNLLLNNVTESTILKKIRHLKEVIKKTDYHLIVVSNETGLSIVPENALARRFREISGKANQIIADFAGEAYLVIAGIGMKIK